MQDAESFGIYYLFGQNAVSGFEVIIIAILFRYFASIYSNVLLPMRNLLPKASASFHSDSQRFWRLVD
jgi:hypothetical protein